MNNENLNEDKNNNVYMDCPYCKEQVKVNAIKCKHCGAALQSKYKDFIANVRLKIKNILLSKKLWAGAGFIIVLALLGNFIVMPLIHKYQLRQIAIKQYEDYKLNSKEHQSNIYKILEVYQDLDTPIAELNTKIKKVQQLINNKKFDELVSLKDIGGYANEGRKISMIEGFGTKLENYVTATNLTGIPIRINFKFDLEETTYTTTTHNGWLGTSYSTDVNKYVIKKDVKDSLALYSMETDKANEYFDKIKYYNGYRITEEHNDGSYRYKWDETISCKAINLTIDSIEIYK